MRSFEGRGGGSRIGTLAGLAAGDEVLLESDALAGRTGVALAGGLKILLACEGTCAVFGSKRGTWHLKDSVLGRCLDCDLPASSLPDSWTFMDWLLFSKRLFTYGLSWRFSWQRSKIKQNVWNYWENNVFLYVPLQQRIWSYFGMYLVCFSNARNCILGWHWSTRTPNQQIWQRRGAYNQVRPWKWGRMQTASHSFPPFGWLHFPTRTRRQAAMQNQQ